MFAKYLNSNGKREDKNWMSYNGRKISIIAAVDKNWAIGYQNRLLISIPEDMKQFMNMTTGGICIMGKGTLTSLPAGKPLKNRVNIVLTHDKKFKENGAVIVNSVEEALKALSEYDGDVYIIGGESIYRQFLEYADEAYITYIDYKYQADRYFPKLEGNDEWKLVAESEEQTYFNVEYYYRKYVKIG